MTREQHDVSSLIDDVLCRALARGASDVHFDPTDADLLIRVRVDGQLLDFERVPARLGPNLIARLKVLGSLLTYRMDIPQEGGLAWRPRPSDDSAPADTGRDAAPLDEVTDLRVATFPTIRGERAVVRVFTRQSGLQSLAALGLPPEQVAMLRAAVQQPSGLLVFTGPAGSGKSTTMYALIRDLLARYPERSIVTLEDPVEQRVDRVTQVQIQPHGELSYERCLRSLLRQDIQVLLIGEIRDARTAAVTVDAALTGHLILTTVHSSDPAQTVLRLLEMGVPAYQLVSTLALVCAQRLLRRRCPACPDAAAADCQRCLGAGYAGRTAIAQIVPMTDDLRPVILSHPSAGQLRALMARQSATLAERAEEVVRAGITTADEVGRVLGAVAGT
ncbi:MAG: hypothetical protein C4547_08955 [Phycisphaerales bacterium]|nr:MAG: hypothetical protein C4547_08955 [Phycisphaerales bacterium]